MRRTSARPVRVRGRLAGIATATVATVLLVAGPATAIVYGQEDDQRHPQTGAFMIEPDGEPRRICSGTLIAPKVFLTAAHCTAGAAARGVPPDEVYVTFEPRPDEDPALLPGTAYAHPDFGFSGPGGRSDPHDIAVIVLDQEVTGITPAALPEQGLLDRLHAQHELSDAVFTAVGYGAVRDSRTTGPQGIEDTTERRYAEQSALALQPAWLTLSMNEATGDGGTCYGDSGGPHFLEGAEPDAGTELVVSITVIGDAVCKATDTTYRLDTESARAFLEGFTDEGVVLP